MRGVNELNDNISHSSQHASTIVKKHLLCSKKSASFFAFAGNNDPDIPSTPAETASALRRPLTGSGAQTTTTTTLFGAGRPATCPAVPPADRIEPAGFADMRIFTRSDFRPICHFIFYSNLHLYHPLCRLLRREVPSTRISPTRCGQSGPSCDCIRHPRLRVSMSAVARQPPGAPASRVSPHG